MKKFVSLFLSLVMLLSITSGLTFNVYAATPTTGKCGENIIWKYNSSSKTLTLSGTGAIDSFTDDDFSNLERPWKNYIHEIENVKIEEGITSIGDYTFKYIASNEIKNIEIPKSLISIGKSAFKTCIINQVSYNGTNTEFFKIKNIENNKELIIGKFNPILNELLSKPIKVEYKQSEYLELTDEYLTKKVTNIINNNENAIKNNINVKNGYLYINNISIGKIEINYDYYPYKSEYDNENEYIKTNIERLHDIYLCILDNDDNTLANFFSTQLKFLNDSEYNESDEQYVFDFVKNLNITKPYYFEVNYDEYIKEFLKAEKSQNMKSFWNYGHKTASKYYNKQKSDDLIKFTTGAASGGTEESLNLGFYNGQHLAIFKNDILYNVYIPEPKYEYEQLLIPVIILPDGLPDDQIENYIMKKINNDWQNNDIYDIIKGAKNEIEIENGYTLKSANNRDSIVIARRSDSYVPSSPTPGGSTSGGGGFAPAPTPEDTDKKDEDKKPETKPAQPTTPTDTTEKPASVKVNKALPKKKALVVYWNKIANASGYQIQVATDKKFKKNKKTVTVAKQNASKKTVKKLKEKKKYFVRVRAYKIVDGKKSYGKWSKIKSVKTK